MSNQLKVLWHLFKVSRNLVLTQHLTTIRKHGHWHNLLLVFVCSNRGRMMANMVKPSIYSGAVVPFKIMKFRFLITFWSFHGLYILIDCIIIILRNQFQFHFRYRLLFSYKMPLKGQTVGKIPKFWFYIPDGKSE